MKWREIVIGLIDEDEESGDLLDPPVKVTLGELVDQMHSLGNELPAPARCESCGRHSEGRAHWFASVEWDSLIDSIVHAIENDEIVREDEALNADYDGVEERP